MHKVELEALGFKRFGFRFPGSGLLQVFRRVIIDIDHTQRMESGFRMN